VCVSEGGGGRGRGGTMREKEGKAESVREENSERTKEMS